MSIQLTLKDDAVIVTDGKDAVAFSGDDVARFAEALANPGKPAFGQDRMLFVPSVATSFGLWLLQDGQLSIHLKGNDQIVDPKVATDFANSLLGPVLIAKATFKVGDEVLANQDHLPDINDPSVKFRYNSYGKVVAVTPRPDKKDVLYSIETDDGTKVDLAQSYQAYMSPAQPLQAWDITLQVAVSLHRDVQVQARTKEDAIHKAKQIRDAGVWSLKNDPTATVQLAAITTVPAIYAANVAGEIENEGWRQDAQGRIRSSDTTKFPSDTDATRFVTTKALEGSPPHQAALRKRLGV